MSKYAYDLLIIGGGSGGFAASGIARGLGKKVAIAEKHKLGGDCTWYGCVPSKTLIKAAQVANLVKTTEKYGIVAGGNNRFDTRHVMAHVRKIRENIYAGETPEVLAEKGIDTLLGDPKFLDPHHVRVGEKTYSANKIIISTGSHAFVPPIPGLDTVPFLTNETLFEMEELPDSLLILGGGPIGIEMAAALNRLGVKVTILEMSERLLTKDEPELVDILLDQLKQEGVNILTRTKAVSFAMNGTEIQATVETNGAQKELRASALLVAVGRRPNVAGLDLEKAGIEYSGRGITVNGKLQTTAPNVYAIGDVAGSYQFSHIAEYHATVAVPNALLPLPIKKKTNYENIVWATFTDPELAHAGLTEKEAREKYGEGIRVYRHEYRHTDRARTDIAEIGLSKFVVSPRGKLLGIHILGHRAAELLHEAQLAKTLGVKFSKISSMIHIYPTYADLVKRPADKSFVDDLQNNFFVKLVKKVSGKG